MPSKFVYYAVAAGGIALASGGAYWYQTQPRGQQAGSGAAAQRAAAGAPGAPGSGVRVSGVEVIKVEAVKLQDDGQSVGTLVARQSVMLRPEVAGRVLQLGFRDGAQVKRGQLLVQLDDVLQRAEVSQAEAQVSIAQANLKRNQELVAQNFVAQRVLDEGAANLQVVQAQLALARARLSRMSIVAPFDASAGISSVSLGDYVKDGADLVNLEDLSSMVVDFRMPERFQTRLKIGQPVELQLDAMPGRVFEARIEAIDPLIDANGRSVTVRASLPNTNGKPMAARPSGPAQPGAGPASAAAPAASAPASGSPSASRSGRPDGVAAGVAAGRAQAAGAASSSTKANAKAGGGAREIGPLRPGMFARALVVFSVKDAALMVPEEAIVPQGGRQFVVKVVSPEEVPPPAAGASAPVVPPDVKTVSRRQEVKLGLRRQGRVEVTEGLQVGDTVVVAGQQRLQRDGSPVRIVELGRAPGGGGAGRDASAPAGVASAPLAAAAAAAASATR